jgi:hypothetical protein
MPSHKIVSTASFVLCDNIVQKDELDIDQMFCGFNFHYNKYGYVSRQYALTFFLSGDKLSDITKQQKQIVDIINSQNRLRYILEFDLVNKLTFSTYDASERKYTYELYEVNST